MPVKINLRSNKKAYFASDFHLGAPNYAKSLERERTICNWLDSIKDDAQLLFLVGDLFDFWFEYKKTIPKGFARFFGKIAELSDNGVQIVIFKGNHDMWMGDYFKQEFGAWVFREPQVFEFDSKKIFVGHGDGLGPGDYFYKYLKLVFESSLAQFLFGRILHSNLGLALGTSWANLSWKNHEKEGDVYHYESPEKEILYKYCEEQENLAHHDFYVFGHRHYKLELKINAHATYINLGDWIKFYSYGVFDGQNFKLLDWKK